MRYYQKEIASNKLYLKCTGAPVPWELVGDDVGVFATNSQAIADELDQAIAKHVGGVVIIDQAQYDDGKKKHTASPSPLNSLKDRFSLSALNLPPIQNPGGLVAATNPSPLHGQLKDIPAQVPEPIKVQTEFVKPKTSKSFFKKVETVE
jgi:hypothetical protein